MKDISKIVKLDEKMSDAYIASISKKYTDFIRYSDLPMVYYEHNIEPNLLTARYKTLCNNIYDIINDKISFIFDISSYDDIGYLVSYLLDTYFKMSMEKDTTLETVIYVDTNLLFDDYKKLMDIGTSKELSLSHSEDTLLRNIENATCVIWDKYSYVKTDYDKQKLYNILLTRYRKGLCNLFFMKNATKTLPNFCSKDMEKAMDIQGIVTMLSERIEFTNKEKKGNIKW